MVLQELADRWMRFKSGLLAGWGERMVKEQDVLADLRLHPGFQALLDTFDAELTAMLSQWVVEDDPAKAAALHAEARAVHRMIRLLEGRTRAKQMAMDQEESYRLLMAQRANMERGQFVVDRHRAAMSS